MCVKGKAASSCGGRSFLAGIRSMGVRHLEDGKAEVKEAVIPPEAWFRLPDGHIRIREWIVVELQNEMIAS